MYYNSIKKTLLLLVAELDWANSLYLTNIIILTSHYLLRGASNSIHLIDTST